MRKTSSREKAIDKFDVIILGDYDENEQLFKKTFPLSHKFINRFELSLREEIKFPKDFIYTYNPEIMDKLINNDILILSYKASNKLSFEFIKKFYYLYYSKFEEKDKPKTIVIIEFDYTTQGYDEKIESPNEIQKLFNAYFYSNKDSEEKLIEIFQKCIVDLKKIYNFEENFSYYEDVQLVENKYLDIFILIYGNKELLNLFLKILFESKCNFKYQKFLDNFYELRYSKTINNINKDFIIRLNLMEKEPNCYNSICNILLYDINNEDSFKETRRIVEEYIATDGPKYEQIMNIFSINSGPNTITENDKNVKVNNGKNLSYEMGASFEVLNINNKDIGEQIKIKIDNILEKIINNINHTKNSKFSNEIQKKQTSEIIGNFEFELLRNNDCPEIFIKEINNRINKNYNNKTDFLFNICPICYEYMNVRINDTSNIITLYCEKCKKEAKGLNAEQFNRFKKSNNKFVHCQNCQKILYYNFETNKLFCKACESSKIHFPLIKRKNHVPKNCIPLFLKDIYCPKHNKFHKYYMKYSKKGLCQDCKEERENKYFINVFKENAIEDLIKQKKEELKKELEFITSLQNKFNECVNSLLSKFEELIEKKIKMHVIKSELINNLNIIRNNYTIISNVNSLKFDIGEKFNYKEEDSTENKINYIYDYLNCNLDIDNLYIGKQNNSKKDTYNGPYNNLINKDKNILVTDICGLNKNKYICVSFNDGQAKIFDSKIYEKNSYPKCIINEFLPNEGINSMYVSEINNMWKINSINNNELIYLNGFEEMKIIQMNNSYDSYNLLYTIKDENNRIYTSIDIDFNNIMILDSSNEIKLINFTTKENDEPKNELKYITSFLIPEDKLPIELNKINDKIISITLVNFNGCIPQIIENQNEITLSDEYIGRNSTMNWGECLKTEDIFNCSKFEESTMETITKGYENDNEKYVKIIYLDNNEEFNEENTIKDSCSIKIKKEFIFEKNYSLLGCISEKENLFLLNYFNNDINNKAENIFYIFNFNICQFVNTFKYHNDWITPILFAKLNNNNNLLDKKEFIICDKELNIIQYCYEKNYMNLIYYINTSKAIKKNDKRAVKVLILDKIIVLLCNDNEYYIINK